MADRASRLSAGANLDERLVGLVTGDDPTIGSFVVADHHLRLDRGLYGGAALAAGLAAVERATGRPARWLTVQFVSSAEGGERIASHVEILASGRSVDQVRLTGRVGDRIVYTGLGATATGKPDGITGHSLRAPTVPDPDDCPAWGPPVAAAGSPVGWQAVADFRRAPLLDDPETPGHVALWASLVGERTTTAAKLGFLADMIPIAICQAAGIDGVGTSLDNTLRLGALADSEWVLLELRGEAAAGGFGHGTAQLWTPDGHLLATASQTARLIPLAAFRPRV